MADALETIAAQEAQDQIGSGDYQEETFLSVLDEALETIRRLEVPFLVMGGVASASLGRPRLTRDVDFFVRPEHARMILEALGGEGFSTEERYPHWLFQARKGDELVDVIFRSAGDIYLDEEMLTRAVEVDYKGRQLPLVPPEDMVVIKAIAHEEHTPRHWFDALGIIGSRQLDWPYLVKRARRGPRRVLSLLLYAQSEDLPVPHHAMSEVFSLIETRTV